MAEIQKLNALVSKLRARAAKAEEDGDVVVSVGYTQNYAGYVHEDLTKAHGVAFNVKHAAEIADGTEHTRGDGQQAKFLEQPARDNQRVYAEIVAEALKKKKTLAQALLLAGLRLQRDSQEIVPVDTGLLKASAFTRLETK